MEDSENISSGNCGECETVIVLMRWREGKRVLVAKCSVCGERSFFDVQKLMDVLGEETLDQEVELDTRGLLLPRSSSVCN